MCHLKLSARCKRRVRWRTGPHLFLQHERTHARTPAHTLTARLLCMVDSVCVCVRAHWIVRCVQFQCLVYRRISFMWVTFYGLMCTHTWPDRCCTRHRQRRTHRPFCTKPIRTLVLTYTHTHTYSPSPRSGESLRRGKCLAHARECDLRARTRCDGAHIKIYTI